MPSRSLLEKSYKFLTILSAGLLAPLCMFTTPSLVILLTLLALNGAAALFARGELLTPFKNSSFYWGAALIVVAFASSFWAPAWQDSLKGTLKVLLLLIMAFVSFETSKKIMDRQSTHRTLVALTGGILFASILLMFEDKTNLMFLHLLKGPDTPKYQYNQASVLMVIFSLPLVVYWFKKKRIDVTLGLFFLIPLSISMMESEAAKIAFIIALIGAYVGSYFKRSFKYVLVGALMVGFLGAPLLTQKILTPERVQKYAKTILYKGSFYHRLYVWNFVGKKALEKPLLGWGMNSSRNQIFSSKKVAFDMPVKNKEVETKIHVENVELLPLHPHNVSLQLWLELGLVGIVLGIAFLFTFIIKSAPASDASSADRFAYYGALAATLTVYLVSYGMWQSWWLALLGLVSIYVMLSLKE